VTSEPAQFVVAVVAPVRVSPGAVSIQFVAEGTEQVDARASSSASLAALAAHAVSQLSSGNWQLAAIGKFWASH